MTKQEFINRVLLIMNEVGMTDDQGNSFIGADIAQVDRYIEGSFQNAWRILAVNVPKSWLGNKSFSNYPIIKNTADGTGCVVLPDDFYLLDTFKMKGWQKPVFEASIENERVSSIQSNPYTRGSAIRPTTVISNEVFEINNPIPIRGVYNYIGTGFTIGDNSLVVTPNRIAKISGIGGAGIGTFKGDTWVEGTVAQLRDIYIQNTKAFINNIGGSTAIPSVVNGWTELTLVSYTSNDYFVNRADNVEENDVYYFISNNKAIQIPIDVNVNENNQVLRYYSLPKGTVQHEIEKALYIKSVTPITDLNLADDIDVNQRIVEPLAYLTAGSVFAIFGKDQLSASLSERGMLMIPGYRSVKGTNVTTKQ